jgi:hypothetical protein
MNERDARTSTRDLVEEYTRIAVRVLQPELNARAIEIIEELRRRGAIGKEASMDAPTRTLRLIRGGRSRTAKSRRG